VRNAASEVVAMTCR